MDKQVNYIFVLLLLIAPTLYSQGQEAQLLIGGGIAPIHRTLQSDFSNKDIPLRAFLECKVTKVAVQVAFFQNAAYIKDNFSFKHSGPSLSLLYYFKNSFSSKSLVPYLRIGGNYKTTRFTTEGYPGISSYEFKIETDNSIGMDAAAGFKYPLGKFFMGLELIYSKNSNSNFIAGGFTPQALNADHYLAEISFSIPIKIAGKKRLATSCPNLKN